MEQKVIILNYNIFFIANPELIRANNAKQIFQNRLPLPLKERKPEQQQSQEKSGQPQAPTEDDSKKEEVKDQGQEQSNLQKKEDISYDVGSEGDKSEDESKKIDQKILDKELSQVIYITITETPTNILFYCPSTKYLNLKNGKYIIN